MEWLERKYIFLISSKLPRFKSKSKSVFNFRCVFCEDSAKKSSKARGYLYPKKGSYRYHCHNCMSSMYFSSFLKKFDNITYYQFLKEKLQPVNKPEEKSDVELFADKMKKPKFVKATLLNEMPKISSLPHDHPAKKYIDDRKIPPNQHYRLYYADRFKELVNRFIPGKLSDDFPEDSRIIIPFVDENKILVGFQGRALDPDNKIRYITIMLFDDAAKIWGMETVDKKSTVYLTEGPFDAMFLPNSIAAGGGNLTSTISLTSIQKNNIVVVYDNEPRNKHIVKQIKSAIDKGFKVVIWPPSIQEKDINQMILSGLSQDEIMRIIKANTFHGLNGLLTLSQRKQCDIEERKRNDFRSNFQQA